MIISQYPTIKTNNEIDRMIENIVQNRVSKIADATIRDLERLVDHLRVARRDNRMVLFDTPDLDRTIKETVNEIERLTTVIKKESGKND